MEWFGILKILEIEHRNSRGELIWRDSNIHNILHNDGEEFILRAAFTGGPISDIIPDNYYLGLDNRTTVSLDDSMSDLIGEPTGNGYQRQPVASSGDFSMNFESSHFIATSPIVAFQATTSSWGPVANLFFTDQIDNSGFLISTAELASPLTLTTGDNVTMRIGMKLRECS